jgi:hypothetical protein
MKTIRMILGALLVTLGIGQLVAHADTPVQPTPPPAAQPTVQGMTADQLGKLLEGLGYQPQAYKNKDGNVSGYSVKITDSTGNWYMNFDLSKDGKRIWVTMDLTQIKDFSKVPAETLPKLFKENEQSNGYPYFAMYQDNWVVLELSENSNLLTPQWLREDIEIVLNEAKKTEDLWTAKALGQIA